MANNHTSTIRTKSEKGEIPPPNYTQIPNSLFALYPKMKEAEIRVVMAIARETFGWHRPKKILSLSRLMKLTGLSKQGVLNGVDLGIERGLILRTPVKNSFEYSLHIQEEIVNEVDTFEESEVVNQVDYPGQPSRPQTVNEVDLGSQPSRLETVNEVDMPCKELKKDKQTTKKGKTTTETKDEVVVVVCEFSEEHLLAYANDHPNIENQFGFIRFIQNGKEKAAQKGKAFEYENSCQSIRDWLAKQEPAETAIQDMPGESPPELLEQFLIAVQAKINPTSFNDWFEPLTAMSRDGTTVFLRTEVEGAPEAIIYKYSEEMAEALDELGLNNFQIQFITPK